MSGNTEAASLWADANVYVTDDLTAGLPPSIDEEFGEEWDLVGLLDGDAGFEEARSEDSTDFYAWGQVLVRTSKRNFSLTRKFTALEDNAVVAGIVYPGSTATKIRVPKKHLFKIAFETFDGEKKKRLVSTRYVEVSEIGTIKDSESELTKYEVTVKIFPTAEGDLFDVQSTGAAGGRELVSIAIAPQTKTIKVGEYSPLAATATYSDETTQAVTALAVWSSLDAAKVTADGHYIRGIATSTGTNVRASYKGQNAVCAVTVNAA
jgi:hypothetical protein